MSIQSEFIDYIKANTTIEELYYMEALQDTPAPYHVFQDVTKQNLKEHLSTKETFAIFQIRSNYKNTNFAQDISLDEEFRDLFFIDALDLPNYYLYEIEYNNVVNIGDPYYTNVKQIDLKFKEK
jgi:hypothetical protein